MHEKGVTYARKLPLSKDIKDYIKSLKRGEDAPLLKGLTSPYQKKGKK